MSAASPEPSRRPIRVLHVVGTMNRGGVETWLMNVLRNVSRDELAFDFVVHKAEAAAYDEELLALGAGRYVCKWPDNPVIYARNFLKILRENGPYDVVHSHVHHFNGMVLLLAKIANIPIRVAHSHSDTLVSRGDYGGVRRFYVASTKRMINRFATNGIAVSINSALSQFGSDWNKDDRWDVIPCGIDFDPFKETVDKSEVRRELNISVGTFVVGHVGRFDEVKNHQFLIDIFAVLQKRVPDSLLLLVGDGKLQSQIRDKVNTMNLQNHVIFAGSRSDVPRIMIGAMNVFVFPSKHEGLGLALVEAQAANLPCIASDKVSVEAKISENCKFVSLKSSAEEWCNCILSMSSDNLHSENHNFSLKNNINALLRVYTPKRRS
ncbi:glycosyltransferase family 1 protein [Deinococcus sp. KSM4-11]|uniref:glycosyltransferase family 1 protein n=1 Tax=Deinococcus sp. KSM4-11 TaxID=2568654 RepID=UPI0010A329E9|nr:glycosyltransferase family 1 protein [Deinococcus sp. KSM4-11]THF87143.1 glycosyltransferase family 1 protein [Deinococcus sp. KSM4-11]